MNFKIKYNYSYSHSYECVLSIKRNHNIYNIVLNTAVRFKLLRFADITCQSYDARYCGQNSLYCDTSVVNALNRIERNFEKTRRSQFFFYFQDFMMFLMHELCMLYFCIIVFFRIENITYFCN